MLKPSKCYGHYHDLLNCYGITDKDDHGYIPFVIVTILSPFPLYWLITWYLTRVRRRVSLMFVYCPFSIVLRFMASDYPFDLWLLITPLIYGFWLPLWFMASDYPFGIFHLFSHPVRTGIERGSGFFHRKVQPFREKRRLVVWDQSKTKLSINKKRSRLLYTAAIPSSTTIF
jgi:hypothetical protein